MNYLQYINSVYQSTQNNTDLRYLVSGVDFHVRQVLGQYILNGIFDRKKILFILDNTQNSRKFANWGRFKVMNPLDGEVDLCPDLFDLSSVREISRFRSLLAELGFDGTKSMKVISYLSFVKETEYRLGNTGPLSIKTLEEYGGTALVKWKLHQLVEKGMLSAESYEYLLTRYSEVSSAAADFEMFLVLLSPCTGSGIIPYTGSAVHLTIGEFASDHPMQEVLCRLMLFFIKKHPEDCAVVILDDGKGDHSCMMGAIRNLPSGTDVHMFTADAFSLDAKDLNVLMNIFPVRIYSRHSSMDSCSRIEACCGHMEVVKRSYSTAIDKRIRASTAFDLLFGTNRTETEIRNAPVQQPRYPKETINSMCPGTAIIDWGGTQSLFQF